MQTSPTHQKPSGFTLIEVVFAIGLVALVMLPIVAMLGGAIDTSRVAFSQVNDARIGAELIGEIQQADWVDVNSWNGREIYFDYQGQRIPGGTVADAVFTARVQVRASRAGVALGNGSTSGNPYLKQVLIAVSSRPGEAGPRAIDRALSGGPGPKSGVHFVRTVIVNAEQ